LYEIKFLIQQKNKMEKTTLRAQACRFRRYVSEKKLHVRDPEPGIAFLTIFNHYNVTFIVDAYGNRLTNEEVHSYDLLTPRVDGYITIEPHEYNPNL